MEPFRGQTKVEVVRASASTRGSFLEKGRADQNDNNDEDPGNYIRQNDPVPQRATERILLLQHAAVCMLSNHRHLSGKPFRDELLAFRPFGASRPSTNT